MEFQDVESDYIECAANCHPIKFPKYFCAILNSNNLYPIPRVFVLLFFLMKITCMASLFLSLPTCFNSVFFVAFLFLLNPDCFTFVLLPLPVDPYQGCSVRSVLRNLPFCVARNPSSIMDKIRCDTSWGEISARSPPPISVFIHPGLMATATRDV